MTDAAVVLDREVRVLVERLRLWTATRWQAAAPPFESRAAAAYHLAQRFAELGGAPVPLPWVAEHVVADQIAVTGHDLARSHLADDVLAAALDELRRTRALLGI